MKKLLKEHRGQIKYPKLRFCQYFALSTKKIELQLKLLRRLATRDIIKVISNVIFNTLKQYGDKIVREYQEGF